MDEAIKAGMVLIGLGAVILLCLIALAIPGPSYVWLAVLVFGVVAAGLVVTGLYLMKPRLRQLEN